MTRNITLSPRDADPDATRKAIKKAQNTVLEDALVKQIQLANLPVPVRELVLVPGRKFRVDLAWPDQMVCVEVQGGIFAKTRTAHSSGVGIQRDAEKANLITLAGWKLLKVTSNHIESGAALTWLEQALKGAAK